MARDLVSIRTGSRYGGDDMRDRQQLQLPNYVRVPVLL